MLTLALPALASLAARWASARAAGGRFWNANAGLALLVAAAIAALAAGVGIGTVAMLAREKRAVAAGVAAEQASAEKRRLEAENGILRQAIKRRQQVIDARTASHEAQETEIATLRQQLEDARRASRVDRSSPVVPGDDPWLQRPATGAAPARGSGDRR